jgi:hypothetical protein
MKATTDGGLAQLAQLLVHIRQRQMLQFRTASQLAHEGEGTDAIALAPDLDDRLIERRRLIEDHRESDESVAADCRERNGVSVRRGREQADQARGWEVDVSDGLTDVVHDGARWQAYWLRSVATASSLGKQHA